jgi:2-methylcitrate dehydratase PrpD
MNDCYSLTERLAQHLLRPVDDATRARARLHLLDWIGCVAGAMESTTGRKLADTTALGNLLEMDDIHRGGLLHPGPVVWATVAAQPGLPMADALDSGVRGYEAIIAVGATFDAHHYAHYHTTATAGVFGAAAAAASYLLMSADQIVDALGNAGSVAGGLWRMRHEHVLTKQFHIMHVVRTGIAAAGHAIDGLTGPRFILEGDQGLYAATCREPRPLVLGDGWRIVEVSFKPWAACRHTHPAIDAALELRERIDLADADILIETYADALTFCDRRDPATVTDAKFSLQHAVAVVVRRGAPQLGDFERAAIDDRELSATRGRVTVAEDPGINARYPAHFGARVSALGVTVERSDALGDPECPLDRAGIVAKAQALMAWGGVDAATSERIVALCLDTDDAAPFDAVIAAVEAIVSR